MKFLSVNELGPRGTTEALERDHGSDSDDTAAGLL